MWTVGHTIKDVQTCLKACSSIELVQKSVSGKYRIFMMVLYVLLQEQSVSSLSATNDILNSTTHLLDSLLAEENYDRQIRPGFGGSSLDANGRGFECHLGPPTVILTDIEIRSFGPISESDMIYSMDCYFRQTWIDSRLKFESAQLDVLSMNYKFLQKIWIPDTFFLNGKSSYLHKVTVPNQFIRVRKDGQLKYSMRLTIKADCPMHLRKFPLDSQACPLEIGSFAYGANEVAYVWKGKEPVVKTNDVVLSQYDFVNIPTTNFTTYRPRGESRSTLIVHFVLHRRRGYFILQYYAPCAMIVGASWVSFWINRSDAPGRVAVGATTVLTMVTMGFGGRGQLQRVAYPTAMDWFVIMCFTFVFAALVEYAFVNFIDQCEKRRMKNHLEKEREKKKKEEIQEEHVGALQEVIEIPAEKEGFSSQNQEDKGRRLALLFPKQQQKLNSGAPSKLSNFRLRRRPFTTGSTSAEKDTYQSPQIAAEVDRYARMVFPTTFALLNVLYWTLFLHTIDDEINLNVNKKPMI